MEVERYFILEFGKVNLYLKSMRPRAEPWNGERWSSELSEALRFNSKVEAEEAIEKLDNPHQVFVRTVEEESPEDGESFDTADCDVMVLDKEINVYLSDAPALGGGEVWNSDKNKAYLFDNIDDAEEAVQSLNRKVFNVTYELKARKPEGNKLFCINIVYGDRESTLLHWSGSSALEMVDRVFYLARASNKEPKFMSVTPREDI